MKQIIWNQKTLRVVQGFPNDTRRELGYLIFKLQVGESVRMPHSRSMPSLGKGCAELRVKGKDGIYRIFYYLKGHDQILIFHAFKKTTEKTAIKDINLGKTNLKDMQ